MSRDENAPRHGHLWSATVGGVPEGFTTHPDRRAALEHLVLVGLLRQLGGRGEVAMGTEALVEDLMRPIVTMRGSGAGTVVVELVEPP